MKAFAETFISCDSGIHQFFSSYVALAKFTGNFDEWAGDQFSHRVLPRMPEKLLQLVADKLLVGSGLGFLDAIGDHRSWIGLGHTYLFIGVGSYITHTPTTRTARCEMAALPADNLEGMAR